MNALAPRLFHPITRTKLFGSPRLPVSKEIRPKRLLSHFSNPSFTLHLCFIFTGFGANNMISASCDLYEATFDFPNFGRGLTSRWPAQTCL